MRPPQHSRKDSTPDGELKAFESPVFSDVNVVVEGEAQLANSALRIGSVPMRVGKKVTLVGTGFEVQTVIMGVVWDQGGGQVAGAALTGPGHEGDASMKVVRNSLSYRVVRRAAQWLGAATRCSLVGRFFLALARVLGPMFAESTTFQTRHVASRRLARSGHPVSVLAISRPYLWLRSALGGSVVGRAARAGRS